MEWMNKINERFVLEREEKRKYLKGVLHVEDDQEVSTTFRERPLGIKDEGVYFDIFYTNFMPLQKHKEKVQESLSTLDIDNHEVALVCCCLKKESDGFSGFLHLSTRNGIFLTFAKGRDFDVFIDKLIYEHKQQIKNPLQEITCGKEKSNCFNEHCPLRNNNSFLYWDGHKDCRDVSQYVQII